MLVMLCTEMSDHNNKQNIIPICVVLLRGTRSHAKHFTRSYLIFLSQMKYI